MAEEKKAEAKVAKETKRKTVDAKEDYPRKRLAYLKLTYGEAKGERLFEEEKKAGKVLYA